MAHIERLTIIGKAGKFKVYSDGTIMGPGEYLQEADFDKVARSAALFAGVSGVAAPQLFAVALQTDYAAWKGNREMAAMLTR